MKKYIFKANYKNIILLSHLNRLVNRWVELQLLGALRGLESDDEVRDGLAVAADRVLRLDRAQLRHLALVHLLRFLDPERDRAPEIFHQNFRLLDLGAEHFRADHRAKRDLENRT